MRSIYILILVSLLMASCAWQSGKNVFYIEDTRVNEAIVDLMAAQPEYFNTPYAIIIFLDTSPCGKFYQETIFWSDWKKAADRDGFGFLYITSEADSDDVAIATRMDNAAAPVLIAPGCKTYVRELDIPGGAIPLKLLIDANGHIIKAWNTLPDSADSRAVIEYMDSLAADNKYGCPTSVEAGPVESLLKQGHHDGSALLRERRGDTEILNAVSDGAFHRCVTSRNACVTVRVAP